MRIARWNVGHFELQNTQRRHQYVFFFCLILINYETARKMEQFYEENENSDAAETALKEKERRRKHPVKHAVGNLAETLDLNGNCD